MAQPFSVFRDPPARFDASRPQTLTLPACFSQKASANVVWSHPAFANRSVYARNDKEIICVSLAAPRAGK